MSLAVPAHTREAEPPAAQDVLVSAAVDCAVEKSPGSNLIGGHSRRCFGVRIAKQFVHGGIRPASK